MENMNICNDDIDLGACCYRMNNPTCLLCVKQRYMPYNYDENFNFKIVSSEEIEE